ncbi:hypothetical protein GCM10027053_42290 [Intrasporangium mesophilum]
MVAFGLRPFRVQVRVDSTGRRELVPPEGLTPWDLRSRRYRRLFHGVYISAAAAVTPLITAEAALLVAGVGAVASHQSAARIWGGIVPDDGLAHVTCARRIRVQGLKSHRRKSAQLGTTLRGVRVTTPASTFVDLSDELGLVDLVVLGDSLVKGRHVTPGQLVEAAAAYDGRSRRLARRAADLVRADVDSPMETRLRLLMVLAGLPEPCVNHVVRWPDGRVRYRFDLCFPDCRVVVEYDGRQHAESDVQWGVDIDRREWMDNNRWRRVVVRSKDIFRTPARTLSRVAGAMRDQGMRVPRLSDEWRLHFPSRHDDIAVPT